MNKLVFLAFFLAVVCVASAQYLLHHPGVAGTKDLAGNYYDFHTGQISSSSTGKVYNTVPLAYAAAARPYPYLW